MIGQFFQKIATTLKVIPAGYGYPIMGSVRGTAPTTTTAGYQGQVVFHSGNRYEMIGVVSGSYIWALPTYVFPADNTEYPLSIENGVIIYKKRISGAGMAFPNAASGTITQAHGVAGITKKIRIDCKYTLNILIGSTLRMCNGMNAAISIVNFDDSNVYIVYTSNLFASAATAIADIYYTRS